MPTAVVSTVVPVYAAGMRRPLCLLWALCVVACAGPGRPVDPVRSPSRDWNAIVAADYRVPPGEEALPVLLELDEVLGDRDSHRRDDCGYGIAVQWLLRQRLVDPAGLRQLRDRWLANLQRGLGEVGTDTVLRRSFSALCLSVLAARDLQTSFLDAAEVRALLDRAVTYLRDERDLRDHEPEVGWIHATAHTADLLKFLARNPQLDAAGLTTILDAIAAKLAVPMPGAFRMGEDERLARAVLAVVRRNEHDAEAFVAFVARVVASIDAARRCEPFAAQQFAVEQNGLHCLRTLHTLLATAGELPPQAERALQVLAKQLAVLG